MTAGHWLCTCAYIIILDLRSGAEDSPCLQGGVEVASGQLHHRADQREAAGGVPWGVQPHSGRGDYEGGGCHPYEGPLPAVDRLDRE